MKEPLKPKTLALILVLLLLAAGLSGCTGGRQITARPKVPASVKRSESQKAPKKEVQRPRQAKSPPGACRDIERAMLAAVNRARAQARRCGRKWFPAAPPVRWNRRLAAAARQHTLDMAGKVFMSHNGSDGSTVRRRIEATGYRPWIWGENVAYGQKSVDEVVDAWLGSPGHCENIMTPEFKEIGAACEMGRERKGFIVPYWTLVFGARHR